jgi:hypothetical protein
MVHAQMSGGPDLVQRVVVGPVLLLAGVAIEVGLVVLALTPPADVYQTIGVVLFAEAYASIGALMMLLGLRYILGPRSWLERWISRSLSRLVVVSAIIGAVIVAAALIIGWHLL